ncbi:MAG: hypothetical protein IJR14_00360 [Synergistaceae bacterium]|nr:hypothetical protein [Synergistaceae bacterium]
MRDAIDASDEIWASLKVVTGAGEMASLTDAGIKSIGLGSAAVEGAGALLSTSVMVAMPSGDLLRFA